MLQNLDGWDYVLLALAAVIAIYSLAVLMNRYRQKTVERLRSEVESESKKTKK